MTDPIREALETAAEALERVAFRCTNLHRMAANQAANAAAIARAALAAEPAEPAEPAEGLSPKDIEAQEAFTQMRDDVLSGVEGLDNDQINSILHIIDNYTPEWV